MKFHIFLFVVYIFLNSNFTFAQEVDISDYLKKIETGKLQDVIKEIEVLKKTKNDLPEVKFLDAVITSDGNEAVKKYNFLVKNFPNFKYADASLYRVFSYYFSRGLYKTAEKYLNKLKADYPNSPYIKVVDISIPEEEVENIFLTEEKKEELPKTPLYKYTIQAGAFLSSTNAENLKRSFLQEGKFSEIKTKEIGGSLLNVVTVGKFKTKTVAENYLIYLKEHYKITGRII